MSTQTPLASATPRKAAPRPEFSGTHSVSTPGLASPRRSVALATLCALWTAIFFASLFAPSLLDDADATHSNAARHILTSGDWVTLYVNGIRYLEKAPLPYWLVAASFRIFGFNTFAAHLPQAIAVLLLSLLGYTWAAKAFNPRTGLYTGVAILTSAGVFLFTRVFIPEVWLSLFLATALYTFLQSLSPAEGSNAQEAAAILSRAQSAQLKDTARPASPRPLDPFSHNDPTPSAQETRSVILSEASRSSITRDEVVESAVSTLPAALYPFLTWIALALAVLTKGLVALVFFGGAAVLYLALTSDYRHWRRLRPFTGILLFLALAAPWHIFAGLRNTAGNLNGHTHGFFWFYFVNEHFLRFLGKRYPVDYNKLPGYLFWSLHLVWLFPWALFIAAPLHRYPPPHLLRNSAPQNQPRLRRPYHPPPHSLLRSGPTLLLLLHQPGVLHLPRVPPASDVPHRRPHPRRKHLFRRSNPPAAGSSSPTPSLTVIGIAAATALFLGLWTIRHLPFVPDIGELLAHRGVGDYTLSMSHLFDLTGPSFAALRLPAILAAIAFAVGPAVAWLLRSQRRHLAATGAIALTSAIFLIAAHIALVRFGPMLSSQNLAAKISRSPHRPLHSSQHRDSALRRSVLRLLDPLLPRPAGLSRRRPLQFHDLRQQLPRRSPHLPHKRGPPRSLGNRPAQAPLRPSRAPRRPRPHPPHHPPVRSRRDLRQSPHHRPPSKPRPTLISEIGPTRLEMGATHLASEIWEWFDPVKSFAQASSVRPSLSPVSALHGRIR